MTVVARYKLDDVFEIIKSNRPDLIWFSAKSRSIDAVIKVYAKSNKPMTVVGAQDFILEGVKALRPQDFVPTVYQWDCFADVYGLIFQGRPWYVKFRIDEDGDLEQISFHPPERDLITIEGKTIPKGRE